MNVAAQLNECGSALNSKSISAHHTFRTTQPLIQDMPYNHPLKRMFVDICFSVE